MSSNRTMPVPNARVHFVFTSNLYLSSRIRTVRITSTVSPLATKSHWLLGSWTTFPIRISTIWSAIFIFFGLLQPHSLWSSERDRIQKTQKNSGMGKFNVQYLFEVSACLRWNWAALPRQHSWPFTVQQRSFTNYPCRPIQSYDDPR